MPMPEAVFCPGVRGCTGCGLTLALRHALDVLGRDTVMVTPSSCVAANLVGAPFTSPIGVPHVISNLPASGGTLTGLRRGLRRRGKAMVNVVGFCGDGGTVDIGLQSLSGAAERGEPVIWICYDNEAYMNTGIQRSGSTPLGAWTTTTPVGSRLRGKGVPRKNIPIMLALHGVPYASTASIAYIHDFRRKLEKASKITLGGEGLAYIHLHQPCTTGWRFPPEKTVEVARLAVLTGAWPVFEIEGGELKINIRLKQLRPIQEYLRLQGRFRHLTEEETARIQGTVQRRWEELLKLEKTGLPRIF
ncbi:MAG: thiamine pyrophosphate-dependent enzyme [Candidatus Geothermarchaeales archaeon]